MATASEAPLVSVIMGVYDCAPTLREAVASIQAQTHTHWELVICDDGSRDGTWELVQELAAEEPRIRVLRNPTNRGLAPSLNRCLAVARGPFVARMDGDDRCEPERLEHQVQYLSDHPEVAWTSSAVCFFDADGTWAVSRPVEHPGPADLVRRNMFAHGATMVRRAALDHAGGYSERPRHRRVEDYHLWVTLYAQGLVGHNEPRPLYALRDDRDAAIRRSLRARLHEAGVVLYAARVLPVRRRAAVGALRPVLLGLVPTTVYSRLHRRRQVRWSEALGADRAE